MFFECFFKIVFSFRKLNPIGLALIVFGLFQISGASAWADTYYFGVASVPAITTNPGYDMMIAPAGSYGVSQITATPQYWYTDPASNCDYNAGLYQIVLWTSQTGGAISNVTVELDVVDNNGSNPTMIGTQTINVNTPCPSTCNGATTFSFGSSTPIAFANQRFRIVVSLGAGSNSTPNFYLPSTGAGIFPSTFSTPLNSCDAPTPTFTPQASCAVSGPDFYLMQTAADFYPVGQVMQSTAGTGGVPWVQVPQAPSSMVFYGSPETGTFNAAYANFLAVRSVNAALTAEPVSVTIGYENLDGTGYTQFGGATIDFTSNGVTAAWDNNGSMVEYQIPYNSVTLNNQMLVFSLASESTVPVSILYGGDAPSLDSNLLMGPLVTSGCTCPPVQQIETPTTNDKVIWLTSQTLPGPLNGWMNTGFSEAGFGNAALWTYPTGPQFNPTIPWYSYSAAANGESPNYTDMNLIRHDFIIPANATNITGMLYLAVDDNSDSWMNGSSIQADPNPTTFITYNDVRAFTIPAGSITPGANVLAIEDNDAAAWFLGYTYELFIYYQVPCVSMTPTNTSTKTQTSTATNTATQTVTHTPTNTSTSTVTNTVTNTATNTSTSTSTSTIADTATNTSTNTLTNTATNTLTDTFTNTPINTYTQTDTFTTTSTNTVTLTLTNTATSTETSTFTDTPTNTPLIINTPTNTPVDTYTFTNTTTATSTNTFTNTDTSTPVMTNTFTNTITNTATDTLTVVNTNTSTLTNTPTGTDTFTPTMTPVLGLSMAKTVSETQANPGDILTYSIGVTVMGNNVNGMVVTDLLPAGLTFVAPVTAGSTALPNWNATTDTLQWTMPSPLGPGFYYLKYEAKVNNFVSTEAPIVNQAQLIYTGQSTPLISSAPVTIIGQFTIKVNVYNEAGEIVKTFPIQEFSQPINSFSLQSSNTITSLKGPGSTIELFFDGVLIGIWDGTNNANSPVTNGDYNIQIDNVSSQGVETSVSQKAIVNRSLSNITANVYNSAGELVKTLYEVVDDPVASNMTSVNLNVSEIKPGTEISPLINSQVRILIQTSGNPVTLTWDGTNNADTFVTPGEYEIEVHWNNGAGNITDISRQIIVVSSSAVSGEVIAKPNVLGGSNGITTIFDAAGISGAYTAKVRIYTLAGELIRMLISSGGTAQVQWDASGMAGGIYIAVVEVDNADGGIIKRQSLKVMLLH